MHPMQDSGAAQRKKMESVKNTQALMKKKYNDIMAKQLEKIAADEYGQVGTSEGTAYQQVRERAGEGGWGRAIAGRCGKGLAAVVCVVDARTRARRSMLFLPSYAGVCCTRCVHTGRLCDTRPLVHAMCLPV